jgi:hypothetical protein
MTLNLANVWTSKRFDYVLAVTVVNTNHCTQNCDYCGQCARCGEAANASVAYSRNESTEGDERDFSDVCLACLVPFIDSIDYLNTDVPIDVEVDRNATARPF